MQPKPRLRHTSLIESSHSIYDKNDMPTCTDLFLETRHCGYICIICMNYPAATTSSDTLLIIAV